MADLTIIIVALVTALLLKWSYTAVVGPTLEEAPELEDVKRLETSEVDASMFLSSDKKAVMSGDFVKKTTTL